MINIGTKRKRRSYSAATGAVCLLFIASLYTAPAAFTPPNKEEYRRFALLREGDAARGKELFADERRAACAKCHSVDGTGSKAGPDLFAVGDKFPRRELIAAVLEPSEAIAVGYGTTIV